MIDFSTKLQGDAYRQYWQARMAKGPSQAGWHDYSKAETEKQAETIWTFIRPDLAGLPIPARVLEFGSGYGRMLRRLRSLWRNAYLYGVDIAPAAIRNSWCDEKTDLHCGKILHVGGNVVLIFTCTALQHVTDRKTLEESLEKLNTLRRGGYFALFENISHSTARHVLGFGPDEYMACFPGVAWQEPRILKLRGEPHAWMLGVKQ